MLPEIIPARQRLSHSRFPCVHSCVGGCVCWSSCSWKSPKKGKVMKLKMPGYLFEERLPEFGQFHPQPPSAPTGIVVVSCVWPSVRRSVRPPVYTERYYYPNSLRMSDISMEIGRVMHSTSRSQSKFQWLFTLSWINFYGKNWHPL